MKSRIGYIISRVTGALLTPLFYFVFGFLLVLFHPVQVICRHIGGYSAHKKSVDILNFLLLRSLHLLLIRVRMRGFSAIPSGRPLIIVANHQSAYDIPPVVWGFRKYHPKFISKKELGRNIPSISYNLKHGGSVLIDRANRLQSVKEIIRLGGFIGKNNYAACIFPEGTRSRDGVVRTFKAAGVGSLLRAVPNALIVPFAISGNHLINPDKTGLCQAFITVTYTALPAIDPTGRDIDEVVAEAEAAVRGRVE
ncbi:MAG: 1-acyl-sn-glycerol-3-phosphate acyltransferase [Bacteroidales bacterium]|nr:1-acyl-sn-glycerol-3-phosphate acyltransferase [Bacteroidales bacterium]